MVRLSSEELQSANEELRSTMEELETSLVADRLDRRCPRAGSGRVAVLAHIHRPAWHAYSGTPLADAEVNG
jgi:hypothetical protein